MPSSLAGLLLTPVPPQAVEWNSEYRAMNVYEVMNIEISDAGLHATLNSVFVLGLATPPTVTHVTVTCQRFRGHMLRNPVGQLSMI